MARALSGKNSVHRSRRTARSGCGHSRETSPRSSNRRQSLSVRYTPRAAYATALLDEPVESCPPLAVAKTDANVRHDAVTVVEAAEWVRRLGVTIENVVEAKANEDNFDAWMTAAALLRCVLEKLPMCVSHLESAQAEGGMLGTGSVNLALPERMFGRLQRGRRSSALRPLELACPRRAGRGRDAHLRRCARCRRSVDRQVVSIETTSNYEDNQ